MMNSLPLRLTILHFAQRLRMEGLTFMIAFSLLLLIQPNVVLYLLYFYPSSSTGISRRSWGSQDERVTLSDSHRMFLVSCQGSIRRDNRPLVGQDTGPMCTDKYHRFEGDRHTGS